MFPWPWSRFDGVSDRQGFQAAQAEVFAPDQRLAGQLKIGEPVQQRFEGDMSFEAGQGCAEAEMGGPAEGEMAIVGAIEIEAVGIGKSLGIAIAGGHHGDHRLPLANLLAAEHHVIGGQPGGVLAGAFVAEQLLDGGGHDGGIGSQAMRDDRDFAEARACRWRSDWWWFPGRRPW